MYKSQSAQSVKPLVQSLGIIAAVMTLVTGVTFAALQSQQVVLQGNSIATAVAALKLSKDNITYASSLAGYTFGSLIPGGSPAPSNGNPIYLQNVGSTALEAKLSVDPALTNPDNVDLTKVHIILLPFGGGVGQNLILQDLVAANSTGGMPITIGGANHINAGGNAGFTMQVQLDSDAVTGSSANIGNLTFNFNGLAVN